MKRYVIEVVGCTCCHAVSGDVRLHAPCNGSDSGGILVCRDCLIVYGYGVYKRAVNVKRNHSVSAVLIIDEANVVPVAVEKLNGAEGTDLAVALAAALCIELYVAIALVGETEELCIA